MNKDVWMDLFASIWDKGKGRHHLHDDLPHLLPGACPAEWAGFVQHDYDWVDRLYLDHDTIGG